MDPGHWHDRYTRPELADAIAALGINGTSQVIAAVRGQAPHEQTVALCDTLAHAAGNRGAYDAAAILADASECMNDDLADGFCEHGHIACSLVHSGKCADECD